MKLKANNLSCEVGEDTTQQNVGKWFPLTSPHNTQCPFLFIRDNLIQVLFSQEVIARARWTPSYLVFLGIKARLHCRCVLKSSSISFLPTSLARKEAATWLSQLPGVWVGPTALGFFGSLCVSGLKGANRD